MGLLDDAIREHLELKRRHGADPSEVARQEQEALGPPRRGAAATEEAEPADADAAPGVTSEPALEDEQPPAVPPADDLDDEPAPPSEPTGEPEAPVAPPAPADEPSQQVDSEDADDGQRDESGAVAASQGDLEPAPTEGDESREDVLEETPDFLQETPEHDRLWFEQKPPRDFDF